MATKTKPATSEALPIPKAKPGKKKPAEQNATESAMDAVTAPETLEELSLLEQDARALLVAADQLTGAETPQALGEALAFNLEIWVAIKTLIGKSDNPLPDDIRHNLNQLAAFTIRTTLGDGDYRVTPASIETMARINLNIADGLTTGQRNRLIRDRAYQLWEDQGCPDGRELANWTQAEQEIQALLASD